VTASDMQFLNN